MSDKPLVTVECEDVDFGEGVSTFGDFANAFRLVPEGGPECFLDFCIYSAQEQRARVVSRVRVHRSFLPSLMDRLKRELAPEDHRTPIVRGDRLGLVMSKMKADA